MPAEAERKGAVRAERTRTNHALAEINPGVARIRAEPLVMGVDTAAQAAPTIGAVTTSSSISGGVEEKAYLAGGQPNLRVLGPTLTLATDSLSGHAGNNCAMYAVEFMLDGTTFEVVMRAATHSSACRVMVDGEWASAGFQGGNAGGVGSSGYAYIQYTFATDKPRLIRVYFSSDNTADVGDLRSIMRMKTETIYAPDRAPLGPSIAVIGDSWAFGTGVSFRIDAFPAHLARALGMNHLIVNARSGTGYINDSNSHIYRPFGERFTSDLASLALDIVIVVGSINDNAYTKSAIQTAAETLYASIKSSIPACKLIVIGPQSAGGAPSQSLIDNSDAIWTAATGSVHVDYAIKPISGTQIAAIENVGGWIRGTGKTSATNGTGNSDRYTFSDGLHLVEAGYRYWGRRAAQAIAAWIAAGMPRASWTGNGPLVDL